jgi:hypothetical protein
MLKDDGIVIIHTSPNKLYYEYGYNIIRLMLYLLQGVKIEKDIRTDYEKSMHINEQTPRSLHKLLKRSGFDSKMRLANISHPYLLIRKYLSNNHYLSTKILSTINRTFFEQIFCKDIYVVAWKKGENKYSENVDNILCHIGEIDGVLSVLPDDMIEDSVKDHIVMGENDKGVLSGSWHRCENWPPIIRWTGKKSSAYLRTDNKSSKLFIKAITHYPNVYVDISVNRQSIKSFHFDSCEWKTLEIELPRLDRNIVEIVIEIDKAWIPDDILKNGDIRRLGIAIHKIWLG